MSVFRFYKFSLPVYKNGQLKMIKLLIFAPVVGTVETVEGCNIIPIYIYTYISKAKRNDTNPALMEDRDKEGARRVTEISVKMCTHRRRSNRQ